MGRTKQDRAVQHGTRAGYQAGCRLDCCRAAWAAYKLKWEHDRGRRPKAQYLVARRIAGPRRAGETAAAYRRRVAAIDVSHVAAYFDGDRAKPIAFAPTQLGQQLLEATAARVGRDPSDVLEQLLRSWAGQVSFDEPQPAQALAG